MGASGWNYRTPYLPDLAAALGALRASVFASGDYLWSSDEDRPATIEQIWANELAQTDGTHSILDIDHVSADEDDAMGALRLLSAAETTEMFGRAEPTAESVKEIDLFDLLVEIPRWSGLAVALHTDGKPSEYLIWGISGD
ncbi:MAG TPA: hypothetical protein VM677_10400 [Actinokineospora sp.]|nr:hypothetical protein [Actinokineospora sp.]